MDAPYEAMESRISHFIVKYESDFRNAASKIFDGLINTGSFAHNVLLAARQYSQENRKQLQVFAMGVQQLLFQVNKECINLSEQH
jgi:hypothetical protein